MILGGLVCREWKNAEQWASLNIEAGYGAVYFPLDYTADTREIDGYVEAAEAVGLVIAEVGVWNNPMSPEPGEAAAALEKCVGQLELADYVGAKCCVNIAGSCGTRWDGPHGENLTQKSFEKIVVLTGTVIDRAKPKNTCYTLEPMPWMYPDSAESYAALIKAIDRPAFGVHFDPVNMISSPQLYYNTTGFLKDFFRRLGPHIKSCHAKDIVLRETLTLHLDECCPGRGNLDYETLLTCMSGLPAQTPLMLEHMSREEDYREGAAFLKSLGARLGIAL